MVVAGLVMTLARRDPGLGIDLLGLALTGAEGLLHPIDRMKFDSVTREMTGRVIRDFEHRGLIGRTGRSGLALLDAEGPRAEAGITVDETTR
jgi:hypothetical protein